MAGENGSCAKANHWSRKATPPSDGPLTQEDREYIDLKFRDGGHISVMMIRKLLRLHDEQQATINHLNRMLLDGI